MARSGEKCGLGPEARARSVEHPADRLSFTPGGKVGLRVNWDESNSSPELNEAVARAKVATDPAERERAFTDIQTIMLEESPFAFLVQTG